MSYYIKYHRIKIKHYFHMKILYFDEFNSNNCNIDNYCMITINLLVCICIVQYLDYNFVFRQF